jgi:hypothetical protein
MLIRSAHPPTMPVAPVMMILFWVMFFSLPVDSILPDLAQSLWCQVSEKDATPNLIFTNHQGLNPDS